MIKNKKSDFRGKDRRKSSGNFRKRKFAGGGQSLDFRRFIHNGVQPEETKFVSGKSYDEYPLHPQLKLTLKNMGWERPTEIQERSFESISAVRDMVGIASTGTGKTGAFLIPIVNSLLSSKEEFQTMVIVPTRELALQVEEEFRQMTRKMNLFIISLIGGQSVQQDLKKLRRNHHLIVGTPGRLTDLAMRNALDLKDVSVLILDEFDRMLDMGFSKDINYLTGKMVNRDQTLLFSATVDKTQDHLIKELLTDPVEIKVSSGTATADHIQQDVVRVTRDNKFSKLLDMVSDSTFEKVLVFAETRHNVKKLSSELNQSGIRSEEIHGEKTLANRKKALQKFKSGDVKVLVATDVASRGLDISDVTHVINYEVPQNYETYIHRIGRTGRAGKPGSAFTFIH